MTKRERLEDLGMISERLLNLIENQNENCPWEYCHSKHRYEDFMERYSKTEDEDKLYDLHMWLRYIYEEINEIYYLARGDEE